MRERRCSERRIHNLQPLWKLHTSGPERALTGIAHSAVIGQNVYLFCASEGLGAVLRASVPGAKLAQRLNLKRTQAIYFAQSIGYPKGVSGSGDG